MLVRTALAIWTVLFCTTAWAASVPPNPTADQVLDALKASGDAMQDFTADVTLTHLDQTTAESSWDSGPFLFQKMGDGDGRFRMTFTRRGDGDKMIVEKHEYTLAGAWLAERDYVKKKEIRRQVVRPGQKMNLFKLGQGLFPLPVGQSKESVHQQFDVSLIPSAKDDPANTAHLLLKPSAGTDLGRKYLQIDVWVDRSLGMPVRITTLDGSGQHVETTDLTDMKMNVHLTDADFALSPISGWDTTEEPFH